MRGRGCALWDGCSDETWAVAAIQVKDLVKLGLNVRPTPPAPHHVEAFGLGSNKRVRSRIAETARIAVWPGRLVTWPPTDMSPTE
jgi:hypothetical protein